ncbi:unnamed protein product [Umbelopsis vinacea]
MNGTQHSEGQKALRDLESKFTSKKTSVHGINGMQLRVLALFPRLFEDYPYPVVITAAILKLAIGFAKVFKQSSEAHLPKLINTEETVRRILPVLNSNDYVARSITLRMLGCMSMIIPEKLDVHHGVVQRLEQATDKPEMEAAIWAADRFCAVSHRFLMVMCSKIEVMIASSSLPPDVRTPLFRILRHMHVDIALTKKAMEICTNMLKQSSQDGEALLKVVLSTITYLTRHSLLNRTEHISLLISYATMERSQDLVCHVLNDLVLLHDGQTKFGEEHILKLMELGCKIPESARPLLKHTYTRCMLILLRHNLDLLEQISMSSDSSRHGIAKDFNFAIDGMLVAEPNLLQRNLTLQCATILNISLSAFHTSPQVLEPHTAQEFRDHLLKYVHAATESLVKAPYSKHKKILLKKIMKLWDEMIIDEGEAPNLQDMMAVANESLMPVLCAKVYSTAYNRRDHEFQPYSQVLDTAERRMSESKIFGIELDGYGCINKIKAFGGWNHTEEKFTRNQDYLWDIANIAGQCKCFAIMHDILCGIVSEVQTEASDYWIQAMIKLSRSESIISSGLATPQPDCGQICELLNDAIQEQLWYQTLMKTFSAMCGPRLYQSWYIQLRAEMLTLIKSTLAIVIEIQKSDQSTHDINALYIRVERKIMTCAKGWNRLASRYRFLERTVYNSDRRTSKMIEGYKIIALTFGYSLSSMKRSVFNCIDPSLIPLFDFAAMADDASLLVNNPVGLCTEVLRATIEWNEVTDMDLSTRIQKLSSTFERYCFEVLRLSLYLPTNFFSNHKSVTVQMSVEPALDENQPILLGAGEDMLIKFEGIVQQGWHKGKLYKTEIDISFLEVKFSLYK